MLNDVGWNQLSILKLEWVSNLIPHSKMDVITDH